MEDNSVKGNWNSSMTTNKICDYSFGSDKSSSDFKPIRIQPRQLSGNDFKKNGPKDDQTQKDSTSSWYTSEKYIENPSRIRINSSPDSTNKTYVSSKTIMIPSEIPPPVPTTSPPLTPPNSPIKELEPLDRLLRKFTKDLLKNDSKSETDASMAILKPNIKKVLVTRKSLPILHKEPVSTVIIEETSSLPSRKRISVSGRPTYNTSVSFNVGQKPVSSTSRQFLSSDNRVGRSSSFQHLRPSDFVKKREQPDSSSTQHNSENGDKEVLRQTEQPLSLVSQAKESIQSAKTIRRHASFNSELLSNVPRRSQTSSVPVKTLVRKFSSDD